MTQAEKPLYQEFVLRDKSVWELVVAFVKKYAAVTLERGAPLLIIITTADQIRTGLQNRRYWKTIIEPIALTAWVEDADGELRQYSKECWHEYCAQMFAEKIEFVLPSGEIVVRRKSTSEMNTREFSEYCTRCEVYAIEELDVEL